MNTGHGSTFGSAFLRSGPIVLLLSTVGLFGPLACTAPPGAGDSPDDGVPQVAAGTPVAAGRYLVLVGGCNDCHTPGYAETGGNVEESTWLTGSAVGYRGPWGTTYPSNLRRTVDGLSEAAWIEMVRTRNGLPPMPWPSLHAMSDADLAALYSFIRALGPTGDVAPTAQPPGVTPTGPFVDFSVQGVPGQSPTDR